MNSREITPIVVFGGEKGGCGKTTLATQIAAAQAKDGNDVLLVNADSQTTAVYWNALREQHIQNRMSISISAISCVSLSGKALAQELARLRNRYGIIIVDVGGRDSVEFRSSLVVADLLVVPVKASAADTWTLEKVDNILIQAQSLNPSLKGSIVLSMVPAVSSDKAKKDVTEMMDEWQNFSLYKTIIKHREVYIKCMGQGLGVMEITPKDTKAVSEVLGLNMEIKHHLDEIK